MITNIFDPHKHFTISKSPCKKVKSILNQPSSSSRTQPQSIHNQIRSLTSYPTQLSVRIDLPKQLHCIFRVELRLYFLCNIPFVFGQLVLKHLFGFAPQHSLNGRGQGIVVLYLWSLLVNPLNHLVLLTVHLVQHNFLL